MSLSSRRRTAAATIVAVTALVLGLGAASAQAAAPDDGLVAAYSFAQGSGSTAANTAPGSPFGAAIVRNVQPSDWTAGSLTLRGGPKTGAGNWVELPDGLLAGARSATVVAEVRASAAMLNTFHFLWSIGNESSATEYFFASLNCGSGRSPLVGVKSAGVERLVQSGSCGVTADQWVSVASVVDGATGRAALYLDGVKVADAAVDRTPADVVDQSFNTIGRAPWPDPLFQGAVAAFRVYDRALSGAEVADVSAADAQLNATALQARAQAVIDGLQLADRQTSTDLDLPTAGGRVMWTSGDPAVVATDGTVNAPVAGQSAVAVPLTATATLRGFTASRTITVTVLPSTESAADRAVRLAQRFVIPSVLESGTALPAVPDGTTLAVTAVGAGISVVDGVVTGGADAVTGDIAVRVTDATTGAAADRVFRVRVLPAATTTQLLSYSRTPTTVAQANNADVALSMHLALQGADGWAPLNENYGIFFARTSTPPPANGTSEGSIRSLRNPHLFRLSDGSFGVVATRTARGGAADGTQTSRMLFARSTDLLSYQEVGMIDLGVTSGVNDPAAVWDSAAQRYVVSWTSDAGAAMYTTFTDLATGAGRQAAQRGVIAATAGTAGTGVADYATGNALPIDAATTAALQGRFGRIVNTGVAPLEGVSVEAGATLSAADLPQRAELAYSDGGDDTRAVAWDEASVAAVDTTKPGTYEVTGTVKQTTYPTPFADERADPSVFRYDLNGRTTFLMIATEDLNMNPIDPANGAHMPLRVADDISDLSDEAIDAGRNTEVDLLRAGDTDADGGVMTGCFWAPEFHEIGGRLSILFMPCYNGSNGRPDMWTGRASIMQLEQDAQGNDLDPSIAANWTKPRKVVRADGSILNPVQSISLDMTYFEDAGVSYYSWQMLGAVFIARMDPADPTRLTSPPVRIVAPEYAWDNTIAEGPNVLTRDGTLYMIYSGSTVGDTYTTGLATAPTGSDLTDPAVWTKLNYPIQKSGPFNGEWQLGTGHGMWSQDEDDNLLYVFHARTDANGLSGRDTFVRRAYFAADGLPVFDMEADEEVAPGNRAVSVTVTVTGDAAPQLDVTAAVVGRCVAGKVVQVLTVTNAEAVPVAVTAVSAYGSKTFAGIVAGKSSSTSFTTRQATVPAGAVTLTASATVDGAPVTVTSQAVAPSASCG